jgi:hypothetical protein
VCSERWLRLLEQVVVVPHTRISCGASAVVRAEGEVTREEYESFGFERKSQSLHRDPAHLYPTLNPSDRVK